MGLWRKRGCKGPEAGVHLAYWRKKEAPREAREELQRGEQEGSRQRGVKKGTHSVCLEGYCKDVALTSSEMGTMGGFGGRT